MYKQAVILVAVLTLSGCGEDDKEDFVRKATEAGQFEITSSELAQDKSKRADVKAFAVQMISDHTAAAKKLDQIAAEAKVTLKEKGVGEKTDYTDDLEDLQEAEDFDNEYIDKQVEAHEDAVMLFDSYAKDGDDTKLKQFASETLPTLKAHLEHAKQLQGR